MAQLSRSSAERRAESFGQRRHHHVDRDPKFHRFAGDLLGVELREKTRQQDKRQRVKLQGSRPVGVGFGEKDNFGPDDSWDTKDPIEYTPSPSYYKTQKTF